MRHLLLNFFSMALHLGFSTGSSPEPDTEPLPAEFELLPDWDSEWLPEFPPELDPESLSEFPPELDPARLPEFLPELDPAWLPEFPPELDPARLPEFPPELDPERLLALRCDLDPDPLPLVTATVSSSRRSSGRMEQRRLKAIFFFCFVRLQECKN